MEHSLTTLEEKFKTLPPDVQQAITSIDIAQQLTDIGKAHHLHIDQLDELFDEAGLVMLGLTKPRNFVANLRKRVEISEEDARAIVKSVDAGIFSPIRESLKKIHGADEAATEDEELSDEERALRREDILRDIEDKEEVAGYRLPVTDKKEGGKETRESSPQIPPTGHATPAVPLQTKKIPVLLHEDTAVATATSKLPEINKEDRGAIYYPDFKMEGVVSEQNKTAEAAPGGAPAAAQEASAIKIKSAGVPLESAFREKFEKIITNPKETLVIPKEASTGDTAGSAARAGSDPYREPIA